MPKYLKFIILFLIALLVFFLEKTIISSWPGFWSRLNLPLILIVNIFIFYNFKTSFYLILFLGPLLDFFSFHFFGLYTISFLLILFIADFIWSNFFTNRSVYSFLLLIIVLSLFYNLISYSFLFFSGNSFQGFYWFNKFFWSNLWKEILWSLLITLFLFYFLNPQKTQGDSLILSKKNI